MIFTHLSLEDLENVKATCSSWKNLISNSVHLWKSLTIKFCDKNKSYLDLLQKSIFSDISNNASKLESFYRKLLKVDQNVMSNNYRVRTFNCLEAEFEGKKVEVNSEWNREYNYKGVYDMVLSGNILIASVYDTIQVWDMAKYKVTNILPSKLLDEPRSKTVSFTVLDEKFLVCGTQNGVLKIYSLPTGKFLTRGQDNGAYITDVNAKGDIIATLNWFGEVLLWKFITVQIKDSLEYKLERISTNQQFTIPRILSNREAERLMDVSGDFLVTTYKNHLTCYHKTEFFRSYPAPSDVFCVNIQGDKLAFGCKGDKDTPSSGILNLDPNKFPVVVFLKTRDNDPVISVSFNDKMLVMGDTNGELHIVNVSKLNFPERSDVTVDLGFDNDYGVQFVSTIRTHEYRAFIWACKTDAYRIFSGDETGKIIVHDYLMFEE